MTQDDIQQNWRWCRKCEGLYFGGHSTRGKCPAGGEHEIEGSGEYGLYFAPGPDQPNWRWCRKCEGLYFGGHSTRGKCSAGGEHEIEGSGEYRLYFAPPPEPLGGSIISGYISGKRDLVQQIVAINKDSHEHIYTPVDNNGKFEFLNLPDGRYEVYPVSKIPKTGVRSTPSSQTFICQGNQSHSVKFEIKGIEEG